MGSEILPRLFELVADGAVSIDVAQYPLADVHDVWNQTMPSGTRVVFTP